MQTEIIGKFCEAKFKDRNDFAEDSPVCGDDLWLVVRDNLWLHIEIQRAAHELHGGRAIGARYAVLSVVRHASVQAYSENCHRHQK
jgi:hypothetical protein